MLAIKSVLHGLLHPRQRHILNIPDAGAFPIDGVNGSILSDLIDHIRVRFHQVVFVFDFHCFFLLCSGHSRIICGIRKAAGRFYAHAAFDKIGSFIKRQAHADAVYE